MVTLAAVAGVQHLPSSLPIPSADGIILGVTALAVIYSLIAGYAALVREAISVYVGLVLANNFGKVVYQTISHGDKHFPVHQTEVQLLLLILPIILLQFGRRHSHKEHRHHIVITLIAALLTAFLLISSAISQLDPLTLSRTLDQSNLASWIYQLRLAWLALVPIAIIVSALMGGKLKRHHRD